MRIFVKAHWADLRIPYKLDLLAMLRAIGTAFATTQGVQLLWIGERYEQD